MLCQNHASSDLHHPEHQTQTATSRRRHLLPQAGRANQSSSGCARQWPRVCLEPPQQTNTPRLFGPSMGGQYRGTLRYPTCALPRREPYPSISGRRPAASVASEFHHVDADAHEGVEGGRCRWVVNNSLGTRYPSAPWWRTSRGNPALGLRVGPRESWDGSPTNPVPPWRDVEREQVFRRPNLPVRLGQIRASIPPALYLDHLSIAGGADRRFGFHGSPPSPSTTAPPPAGPIVDPQSRLHTDDSGVGVGPRSTRRCWSSSSATASSAHRSAPSVWYAARSSRLI